MKYSESPNGFPEAVSADPVLTGFRNIHHGNYLHSYELTYRNREQKEKVYEMVSRKALSAPADIGRTASGVTIAAAQAGKLLLLREFRMSINRRIYNLCAGMLNEGESIEECAARELMEETGLKVGRFLDILPASYSAVGFSDVSTHMVFLEAEGDIHPAPSPDESITAAFYSPAQLEKMLRTEVFSSRSQTVAWMFCRSV